MELNATPVYDASDNPTGCCPRFNPEGWDDQALHFESKPFVKARTRSLFHIPLNMGSVFTNTFEEIERAHAVDERQAIILSRDLSPWSAEHYFAVRTAVPDADMAYMSGDYRTKVFEGPYKDAPKWEAEMTAQLEEAGETAERMYFFYTTCPKCAKAYGKNYVVGVAELGPHEG